MKILHVAQRITGGPASHLSELWSYQKNKVGVNNIYFLIPENEKYLLNCVPESNIIPFNFINRSAKDLFLLFWKILKVIRSINPDIVHFHSTYAGLVGRPACIFSTKISSKRVVYTPHGWAFFRSDGSLRNAIYRSWERLMTKFCGKIVCVSNAELVEARKYGFKASKLILIRNGVGMPRLDSDHALNKGLGGEDEKISVIYVGRFDQQKGIDILFDLFSEDSKLIGNQFEFTLVGDYVNDQGASFPRTSNIKIRYTGWIERGDVVQCMNGCDLLVMPSRWEGLPITALEAMSLGKCLVVSNIAPLKEVVEDGNNGRIFDLDGGYRALKQTLLSINRFDIEKFGKNSFQRYKDNFSSDKMNELIFDVYQSLVDHG